MNDTEKAQYLLEHTEFMVLSTADEQGKPSVSPVAFCYDERHNLYWVSDKAARHSRNVRVRPQVAIAIFGRLPDGGVEGIYFDTQARELEPGDELAAAIKRMQGRQQSEKFMIKSLADVTGNACWRLYKATPHEIT